jgi:hypothetical protein
MDDVALANYVAGISFANVEAGRLDGLCGQLLGLEPGIPIWLSDYTLMKLRQRHGEINFSHYGNMQFVLLKGFLAKGRESNLLELWWIGRFGAELRAFLCVLKATRKKEVFVSTFHRIDLKEARRFLKRAKKEGRLVREQSDGADLLRPGTDHLREKRKA